MSVEAIKSICDTAAVVMLFLTFLAGAGALVTGNIINARQAKELQQFDADITKAKSDLALQQERAATAEGRIALTEQHASEANAKAEGFRLSIATANESAAKAQAQVAAATAEAAKASLELARIRMPRSLSPEQQKRVAKLLTEFPGTDYAFVVFGDPESLALLGDIDNALQQAGWNRVATPSNFSSDIGFNTARGMVSQVNDLGLKVSYPPDSPAMGPIVVAVAAAISAEGVPCEPHFSDRLRGSKIIIISAGQKRL